MCRLFPWPLLLICSFYLVVKCHSRPSYNSVGLMWCITPINLIHWHHCRSLSLCNWYHWHLITNSTDTLSLSRIYHLNTAYHKYITNSTIAIAPLRYNNFTLNALDYWAFKITLSLRRLHHNDTITSTLMPLITERSNLRYLKGLLQSSHSFQ
jgi:hypothetical protein